MKVEMLGTEKERLRDGCTMWRMQNGTRTVIVRHNHNGLMRPTFHVTRIGRTGVPTGDYATVSSRDFGDVLTVVRDMLGVRS